MMEQNPDSNPDQAEPVQARPSLGTMLREARDQLGLSVADVAAQIKFAPRQIEALEAEDFEHLPETAFLRGFVRSYAKILNLDADTLLAALPEAKPPTAELVPASVDVPFPANYSAQKNLILLAAALLMAVIVAGFAVWHFTNPVRHQAVEKIETPVSLPPESEVMRATPEHRKAEPEPADRGHRPDEEKPAAHKEKAAPAAPVVLAKSAVVATHKNSAIKTGAASGTMSTTPVRHGTGKFSTLHLVFDEESWTEITDGNGQMISSQVNPPGSELSISGELPLSLVIGHAAATHLYQDGKPVDLAPHTNSSSEVARLTLE